MVALLLAASLAGVVGPAKACSCAAEDTRTQLQKADAAFIGVYFEHSPPEPAAGEEAEYRFRVDERIKGDLGEVVVVRYQSLGPYGTCGLGPPRPEQAGWLLQRQGDGRWALSGCPTPMEPDALRAAARPLPAPPPPPPPPLAAPAETTTVPTTIPTTAAPTTTTTSTTAPEELAARPTSAGSDDVGSGLVALATAMWLSTVAASVVVRRRFGPPLGAAARRSAAHGTLR